MKQQNKTDNVLVSREKWERTVAALNTCRLALEIITEAIDDTAQSKEAMIAKEALDMPDFVESERDVEHIKQEWNTTSDEFNQFDTLDSDEVIEAAINALAYRKEGELMEQVPTRDLQILLLSTFRYSLGRTTYMSSVCVEWLTKWWEILPREYKRQIHEDIKRAIELKSAGDECDVMEWKKLLELKK